MAGVTEEATTEALRTGAAKARRRMKQCCEDMAREWKCPCTVCLDPARYMGMQRAGIRTASLRAKTTDRLAGLWLLDLECGTHKDRGNSV